MARLPGLLKRTSKAEELELELARQGSAARLERLMAQRAGIYVEGDEERVDLDESPAADADGSDTPNGAVDEPVAAADAEPDEDAQPVIAAGAEPDEAIEAAQDDAASPVLALLPVTAAGVPVMAPEAVDVTRRRAVRRPPSVVVVSDDWDSSGPDGSDGHAAMDVADVAVPAVTDEIPEALEILETPEALAPETPETAETPEALAPSEVMVDVETEPMAMLEIDEEFLVPGLPSPDEAVVEPSPPRIEGPASRPAKPRARKAAAAKAADVARPAPKTRAASAKSPVVPPPPPRVRPPASTSVHPKRAARQPRLPVVLAACPSCAVLLDPRPTASRRCVECRERIVVKRLEGGVLYLTAPAAAALEAAQRRLSETARLTRLRGRWLAQASAVGALPGSVERIGRVVATEDGVQAARALYLGAANRAYVAARRERRFAEASSIRRAHALVLQRELGAGEPVTDEIVALYRDAMSAELKALREFGRDAELVAPECCEACQADGGLITRISDEVKGARLPHAGCPKGICRCRWTATRVGGRRPAVRTGSAG